MTPEAKHKIKLELLRERSELAEAGGGEKRIEKQRAAGKMNARVRHRYGINLQAEYRHQ